MSSFVSKVDGILDAMLKCDFDDFMLILKMDPSSAGEMSLEFLKDNVSSGVRVFKDTESGNEDLIVISNTDCKIDGYGERWLMEPTGRFWD